MLLMLLACGNQTYFPEYGSTVVVDPAQLSYYTGCRSPNCVGSCDVDDYGNGGVYQDSCDPVDGFGDAVEFHATVLNPEGEPVNGSQVIVQSQLPTMYVIPSSGVQIVDAVPAACQTDPTVEGCEEFFFADNIGIFFQLSPELGAPSASSDSGGTAQFRPTYAQLETDRFGTANFWVFSDRVPFPGTTTSITVSIGTAGTNIEVATGD